MLLKVEFNQKSVDKAFNGEQACRLVEEMLNQTGASYDVIFMDLEMPLMNGFEATRQIMHLSQTDDDR